MKSLYALLLIVLSLVVVGCGAGDAGKATEEDKKNLTNMIENGIGTGPPGSSPTGQAAPSEPAPASGAVSPP